MKRESKVEYLHCAEPKCPECNLAAYKRGREELEGEYAHGHQIIVAGKYTYIRMDVASKETEDAYRQGRIDGLKEALSLTNK